ncbi:hypothetical protein FNF31_07502 [Cafeteria roenbergensis]|uniref:Major capsid protein V20 C-terminal domain-containing protein n=1 Tax=Cafeteria roenbergensis TaxID=33653 RepID=A0A5A8C505_CAFRO|nr:hypothetical protein FNF31_07502 [Cafeteria roenbergensis]
MLVPETYRWQTPENAQFGARLGNRAINHNRISSNEAGSVTEGTVSFDARIPDGLVDSNFEKGMDLVLRYTFPAGVVAGADRAARRASMLALFKDKIGLQAAAGNNCIDVAEVQLNEFSTTTRVHDMLQIHLNSTSYEKLAMATSTPETDDYDIFAANVLNDPLKAGASSTSVGKTRGVGGAYNYEIVPNVATDTDYQIRVRFFVNDLLMANPLQYNNPRLAQPFKDLNTVKVTLQLGDIAARPRIQRISNDRHVVSANVISPPLESKTFTMTGVPNMLAIYVERPRLLKTDAGVDIPGTEWAFPNRFCPIQSVSIDIGNKTDLLGARVTPTELYKISTGNGYSKREATFAGIPSGIGSTQRGAGSIFYVRPSDLGLTDEIMNGSGETIDGIVRVTVKGASTDEVCYLRVFLLYDVFVYEEGDVFTEWRPRYSPGTLLDSEFVFTDDSSQMNAIMGGWSIPRPIQNAWTSFTSWLKTPRVRKAIRQARNHPVASAYVGDSSLPGGFAKSMGYGDVSGGDVLRTAGGKPSKKGLGKLTKKQLMAMISS